MASENGAGRSGHVYPQVEEAVLGQVREAINQIDTARS